MISDFTQMRIADLQEFAFQAKVPGMSRETFRNIFKYLLSEQKEGHWQEAGRPWGVVLTSVMLKSFANMKFRTSDAWEFDYRGVQVTGSVSSALDYVSGGLQSGRNVENVGEDIWDVCQALLAMALFGRTETALWHARKISTDWKRLYERECDNERSVRWNGPAYLAAMVDVISRYRSELGQEFDLTEITDALKGCELREAGRPTGAFQATHSDENVNRWTTALVLRTLCALPSPDVETIERCAAWLVAEFARHGWNDDPGEASMFIARALSGLHSAREYVSLALRVRIDKLLATKNNELQSLWNDSPDLRRGTLKAYTAVGEYLSSLLIPAPAGLIFSLPAPSNVPGPGEGEEQGKIFIVHGRDMEALRSLEHYVRTNLRREPIILKDRASGGSTVIEKFEEESRNAQLVFVLLTPDDTAGLADTTEVARRARQNVIFELGYFIGRLGRKKGRVILLCKGDVELPSDIRGVITVDIRNGIDAAGEEIRRELPGILRT